MQRTQLVLRRKETVQAISLEVDKLEELPKIKEVLDSVSEIKFGQINQVAQDLGNEIHLQLKYRGLYSQTGEGTFQLKQATGKGKAKEEEELVPGSALDKLKESFFSLSRILSSSSKGKVLLNSLSIYLGLAIVDDQVLKSKESRRRLLLESFNLYQLPVGLYNPQGQMAAPREVAPSVFFDMQEIERGISVFKKKTGKTKVDIIAYNALMKKLSFMMSYHKADRAIQDWCGHKLKELEVLAQSLSIHTKVFELNKGRLYKWHK